MAKDEILWEELVERRMAIITKYREEFPKLGSFGSEQYVSGSGHFGEVFIPPPHLAKIWPFTQIKEKHLKPIMLALIEAEATSPKPREVSEHDIIEAYLWLRRSLRGWGTETYLKTGMAGLAPQPKKGILKTWLRRG